MKKRLYFTIQKEIEDSDLTGWKKVTVYDIQENVPRSILELEIQLSDNSEREIRDFLVEELGWSEEDAKECILILL